MAPVRVSLVPFLFGNDENVSEEEQMQGLLVGAALAEPARALHRVRLLPEQPRQLTPLDEPPGRGHERQRLDPCSKVQLPAQDQQLFQPFHLPRSFVALVDHL